MAGNTLTLEFAGDATKLQRAAQQAMGATDSVARAARDSGAAFDSTNQSAGRFQKGLDSLGSGADGMAGAFDSAGAAVQAVADIQDSARANAQKLARANHDVAQAQQDVNQAMRDGKQAQLDVGQAEQDLEQARLDQKTAMKEYQKAVKENGAGSDEAAQALLDMKQAGLDVKQAEEDKAQALEDGKQSTLDAEDAQLNLNDAMKEANPPDMQVWADKIAMFTPVLGALAGVIGIVTLAQGAWNLALALSPMTWIILAIIALVAVIVLIATKTTWFQDAWKAAWRWIKDAASAVGSWFKDTLWGKWIKGAWEGIVNAGKRVWEWMKELPGKLKDSFLKIADFVSKPFKAGFNAISDAWNNTVGRLSWSVPGWVPFIGGSTISAPQLPKFHTGGVVPGMPGQEVPIMALAGEEIRPRGTGGGTVIEIRSGGSQLDDLLVELLARAIGRRGGNVQSVLGSGRA